ncbi:hypothetical protein D3C75_1319200 [compost metagenome]
MLILPSFLKKPIIQIDTHSHIETIRGPFMPLRTSTPLFAFGGPHFGPSPAHKLNLASNHRIWDVVLRY